MTTNSQTLPLRFGISSLDVLTNPSDQWSSDKKGIWTAALVGPDGCGKSILALHLASTYRIDHEDQSLEVIYASTDFSFEQAQSQWAIFGLDYPRWREESIEAAYNNRDRRLPASDHNIDPLELCSLRPITKPMTVARPETDLVDFLTDAVLRSPEDTTDRVHFVDLQSETAGDDWGFLNHLIGLLPARNTQPEKHLLIIDAVEGLEAFVGDQDAFGQRRDRRSRVAQLIRRATAIGVHLLFIVEEPDDGTLLPERFVTDLVIRLRRHTDREYTQRTIEIEKCRAIAHVRGEHEFSIRRGTGAATGNLPNLDDPRIVWRMSGKLKLKYKSTTGDFVLDHRFGRTNKTFHNAPTFLPHIHVTPSLYCRNAQYRSRLVSVPQLTGSPTFGLEPLDRLLSHDVKGSRLGSLSILLGESGTHKGRLARRYLAQAFVSKEKGSVLTKNDAGVAVLLSTRFIDHNTLVEKLGAHLNTGTNPSAVARFLRPRVFCHRYGARQLTSGAFIDILIRYLTEAFKVILPPKYASVGTSSGIKQRRSQGHRIRIVLEDWNALLAAYPNLQQEPLLLSTVLAVLRSECVSALIVSTQPGQPGVTATDHAHELRNVDEPQIFTWAVPFYGDRRIAITAHSIGTPHRAPIICELESQKDDSERLTLNRHFDLYADVDIGKPRRVPLVVRLYFGKHVTGDETASEGAFAQWLQDTFMQSFPAPTDQELLRLESSSAYFALYTFAEMLDHSQLDHSLVLQIDEFWSVLNPQVGFFDLNRYWTAPIVWTQHEKGDGDEYRPEIVSAGADEREETGCEQFYFPHRDWYQLPITHNDPTPRISSRKEAFGKLSSPSGAAGETQQVRRNATLNRACFFTGAQDSGLFPTNDDAPVFRIPYLWDFGIILADRELWDRYKTIAVTRFNSPGQVTIGQIWNSLCRVQSTHFELFEPDSATQYEDCDNVQWYEFLEACRQISALENIPAFDVDLTTVETISCFVLELWASLLEVADAPLYDETFARLTNNTCPVQKNDACPVEKQNIRPLGLRHLLTKCGGTLLQALVQLIYTCPQLRSHERTIYREHVSERAVASREWYSTASTLMRKNPETRFVPLSLPGTHAVRGDWHLAVARGSRSEVLAAHALDLLSSRRSNLLRLQDGIGLPVRDVVPDQNIGDMPTGMSCYDHKAERSVTLNYRDICYLGKCADRDFHWLWRSRISYYERDCFYWRRWIARMFAEQYRWFPPEARNESYLGILADKDTHFLWQDFELVRPSYTPQSYSPVLLTVFERFLERLQILRSAVRDSDIKTFEREITS